MLELGNESDQPVNSMRHVEGLAAHILQNGASEKYRDSMSESKRVNSVCEEAADLTLPTMTNEK